MASLIRQRSKCGILDSGGGYVMTFPLDSRQMIGVGGVRVMAHAPPLVLGGLQA